MLYELRVEISIFFFSKNSQLLWFLISRKCPLIKVAPGI